MHAVWIMPGPARRRVVWVIGAVAIAVVGGCGAGTSTPAAPTSTATTSAPTSPPATRAPAPTSGPAAPDCADGWTVPVAGTALRTEPLDLIRGEQGVRGEFTLAEMRYFTGPDSPGIISPRVDVVRRWNVKAALAADPGFAGRWIIEVRDPQRQGIAAVAPVGTTGYASPDWRAFEGDGAPRAIPRLPGRWPGLDYDFVTGEGGGGNRGLPPEVEGCLAGT